MNPGLPRLRLVMLLLAACTLLFRFLYSIETTSYAAFLFQPSFSEHVVAGSYNGAADVFATDLDGDGDMDILGAANNANDITWWDNDGSESFTKRTIDGDHVLARFKHL